MDIKMNIRIKNTTSMLNAFGVKIGSTYPVILKGDDSKAYFISCPGVSTIIKIPFDWAEEVAN